MPTKRAIARRQAAEPIDIESRLAPFFSGASADEGEARAEAADGGED